MTDVNVPGFGSSNIFASMKSSFDSQPAEEKQALLKKVNAIFEFQIKNAEGKEQIWTADIKKNGSVVAGKGETKPDITLILSDKDLLEIASGKLNGQKAFMGGKLKIKGNMMLATKLDVVLKSTSATQAKL
ncbi:SCP2 sterol-binding domain-containing protein [Endogone sp. FLAS-F59071]|nr:SCP2 sterol-binding domain-containing protein [Endogone sp. FLAS-F59071]|eukprot:RUS20723.1 SCP2 sterol-binding domain-containing protein [Endogone sp. FLAS-F59071]